MTAPQLWVFAGPNGAGKSTLVAQHVRGRFPIVNPDELVVTGQVDAGREAVRLRREHLAARATFGVETTLTGKSEIALLRSARAAGYKVSLVYVGVRDVDHSISRVRSRVAGGGHDVPLDDLLRRFDRSIANLAEAAPLVDRLIVFDNSASRRRLVLWRDGGRTRFLSDAVPSWLPALLR